MPGPLLTGRPIAPAWSSCRCGLRQHYSFDSCSHELSACVITSLLVPKLRRSCEVASRADGAHFRSVASLASMAPQPEAQYRVDPDGVAVITLNYPPLNALHPLRECCEVACAPSSNHFHKPTRLSFVMRRVTGQVRVSERECAWQPWGGREEPH